MSISKVTHGVLSDKPAFVIELEDLINKHSMEDESNTPDYLLAAYLRECMAIWARYTQLRDKWYGVHLEPGASRFERQD